jgi:hypothetical protein
MRKRRKAENRRDTGKSQRSMRLVIVIEWHVLKPETAGTKPPERPEHESEKTETTETKIEHGIPPP